MEEITAAIVQYRYLILFPLAALEGPVVALAIGFLIHLQYLSFIPAYIILIFGDLIPDTIYYYIGRFGNKTALLEKYRQKPGFIAENFKVIEHLWQNHGRKTMFFSKLAYGLSTPFLISAGLTEMPFKRFFSYALPIILFQYAALLWLGYYLGQFYQLAAGYVENAGMLVAAAIIVFFAVYFLSAQYARRKLIKMEQEPPHNSA